MSKMKKYLMFLFVLFAGAIALIAQEQPDTIPVNVVIGGESILDILKANWAIIAVIVYSILEFWLGQTGKVKEGSFLAMIINFIGKFIKKQLPVVKGKFMNETQFKAIRGLKVFLILLFLIPLTASAQQGPFKGFFKPAKANPAVSHMVQTSTNFKTGNITADNDQPIIENTWLIRPTVGIVAKAFTYNKDMKELQSSTFNKIGFGMGYQRYEEINGEAYNSLGVNALLLFDSDFSMSDLNFTTALTIHALKIVDVGIARDFGQKQWLLLSGITYSF